MPGEHRVEIELFEFAAAVGHRPARQYLESLELFGGARTAMGFHEGHHDVGSAGGPAVALIEHGERLPDAWRGAEIDAELPSRRRVTG